MMELKKFLLIFISYSLIITSPFAEAGNDASSAPSASTTTAAATATPTTTSSTKNNLNTDTSSSSGSWPKSSPSGSTPSKPVSPAPAPSGLSLLFSTVPLPTKNPVLKKICDSTSHPEECMSSITPYQTGESDPVSVLKMEMQALRKGFEKAIAKADSLNEDPSTSEMIRSCIDTCLEIYDTALYDLDDALEAVSSHDIDKLKTFLSATVSDISTCEEAFQEEPGAESPLKEFDDELDKLASNNLAIVNALLR
ncbi:hypothetical protein JCGZ_14040 [Jatropha curcas]|uniref:Pectinesterase inhibitor domain-containing protein n=1 Tax=Jatropha curcas TaxID=180498 RepID=A0A067K8Z6_JATCU|nr:pectinesterase 3 [Jatropha curcas]KDP28269.1 hypothetical protein JCGZ_14040 [Jatropha curcas]